MTTTELRALMAALPLPLTTDGVNVRDATGRLICVCAYPSADRPTRAALFTAITNKAEELLDKAEAYDKFAASVESYLMEQAND